MKISRTGFRYILPFTVSGILSLTSCIKDELPNSECDIISANAGVKNPEDVFFQLSDTSAAINADYHSSVIQFQRVKTWADLTEVAPRFTVSEGALLYPPSGTVRDFSNDTTHVYFCVAEDERPLYDTFCKTGEPMETQLAQASRDGRHIRTYIVQYKHAIEVGDIIEYNFEHYGLNSKGKYYEWCDQLPDGSFPEVPNWATANAGFAMARGTAKPEEYPTTPIEGEGVDGGACVKLETSSTGSFGAMFKMPIAAGNLYLGTFDSSKALTMTLKATRFGDGSTLERQLDRFTGHYKFYPGSQMTDKDGKPTEGEDRPAIYCIIYKNHDEQGNPVVIFGDDVQTSPQIIARAEVSDWQVNTDEWVEFDLPFVWKEDIDPDILANKGYNVAIVCSSSRNGDAFVGAIGSRLYVDNFKLYSTKGE